MDSPAKQLQAAQQILQDVMADPESSERRIAYAQRAVADARWTLRRWYIEKVVIGTLGFVGLVVFPIKMAIDRRRAAARERIRGTDTPPA